MKNIPLLLVTLIGSFVLLIVIVLAFSKMANQPVDPAVVMGQKTLIKGKSDAKVTIVEFSDFQCPACSVAAPLVEKILSKNENVQVIYRYFPLVSIHEHAQAASEASFAAYQLGKFWEYHTILFEKQNEWSVEKDPKQKFIEYAVSLGINKDEFTKKLNDSKAEADKAIAKDIQDGTTLGIAGTPSFFVNGIKTEVPDLESAVEKSLAK